MQTTQRTKRVAVVTGGADGIGASISCRMAQDGYTVAILDFNRPQSQALVDKLRSSGGEASAFYCDLSVPQEIETAFDQIMATYGRVDVLVNNAGVGGYLPWLDMTLEQWHRLTQVNCDAVFLCVQRAAKEMVAGKIAGKILVILSEAALNQDEDIVVPYGTSKWCARGIMRSAAAALLPYGITVNGICPGTVWTPMMEGFCNEYVDSGAGTREAYIKFIESKYPTGRLQTGEDIAAACSFLIREGHNINGQSLLVAGGIVYS